MRATTSASNIFRRKLCPGSHNAEASVEEVYSDAADEGTLLHPFACNPKLSRAHLTTAQQTLLARADQGYLQFEKLTDQEFGKGERAQWIEESVTIYGPDQETLFTGQSDLVWKLGYGSAIMDFKMGFVEVTTAPGNYQIASYAVGWTDFLGTTNTLVAINQPRAKPALSIASYSKPQIEAARAELAAIYHSALDKNAPRIVGDMQCRFCKAKLFCDEYKRRFAALSSVPERDSIATLDAPELVKFFYACKAAASIRDQVNDEMRRRIEADEMPGWTLEPSGETREVTDIVAAYQAFAAYFVNLGGIDAVRFTACTKLSLTELAEYARYLTGFPQNKAKRLVAELLNQWITRKEKRPTPTQNDQ